MDYSKIILDKNSKTPLYMQLKQILLKALQENDLMPGDLIPSESTLSQTLGISKATVRQCMGELSNEGYVEKRRNRGTIVLNRKLNLGYSNDIFSFAERVKQLNMVPRTQLLHLSVGNCPKKIAKILSLHTSDRIIHLTRLRYADEQPFLYIESFLPYEENKFILSHDLEAESLYSLLDQKPSSRICQVTRTVYATQVQPEVAKIFGVSEHCAMLTVETIAASEDGRVEEYSISHSPNARNQYTFTLNR